ncbi:pepsin/retropepsin-like aspartic protease family protein [Pedobacter agri]|uniref:pepsin/retropepsin-like aspartic protease family protein n=1 Tax=Pedobacter agri TaxID=454586 RepID=UPI0029315C06|nr:pepsin/retropepsin-like aspartic protease family protein [Pedobacter agri]
MYKISICLFALLASFLSAKAQNSDIEPMIDYIVEAINTKQDKNLLQLMREDCTIGNLESGDNTLLLPAILQKFSKILTYHIASDSLYSNGDRLVTLKVAYTGAKSGTPTFTFDQSGRLINLGIIRMRKKVDAMIALTDALSKASRPDTVSVPIQLVNGLIYVQARLNGQKGYFLFDSGCPVILLNRRFTEKASIVKDIDFDFLGMGGKMDALVWSKANSFSWANTDLEELDAPAKDFDQEHSVAGSEFLGMIGYGFFKDYQLSIDYQSQLLLLEKVENSGKLVAAPIYKGKLITSSRFVMKRHLPVVQINVLGRLFPMGIDCGANANVLQENSISELGKAFDPESQQVSINGVGTGNELSSTGYVIGAKIGKLNLQDMFTVLTRQPIGAGNEKNGLGIVGLLGTPFLNQYTTTLNFKSGTIMFYHRSNPTLSRL